MQMSLFLRATVATLCLFLAGSPRSVMGLSIGGQESPCPLGSFRHAETGRCRDCTHPCPKPLVETSACRHDADAVCVTAPDSRAAGVVTHSAKLCPFDSFLNAKTGMCQECTRFCQPPLVMTVPCLRGSDAVCSRPHQLVTKRPEKRRGASSRRRKVRKERRRRKKTRKRTKGGASHSTTLHSSTSSQLCIGDGSQFYNLELGRCFPCRSCEPPETEEYLPCTSTSDRVCRPAPHSAGSSTVGQNGGAEVESNELPQDGSAKSESINRSHNNEYPDLRPDTDGGRRRPWEADNAQRNSATKHDQTSPDSLNSNIAE